MANLYNVPLENGVQLTLQNALLTGVTTSITFTATVTSKLQASATIPGILVIDRVDANGNETPTKTEYISFTGVSGSTVTGLTRGLTGTSDQDHAAGAIVEFVPDVTWADAINDVFTTEHNANGTHKAGLSLASASIVSSNIDTFSFKNLNAPEGFLINGKIVPSVASNNLTVAIKTMDGNDATASNPIYVRIGDNIRTITGSLSVTLNAGTNWFNSGSSELAAKEVDYFVYLGDDSGTIRVGFGRIPNATRQNDYSSTNTSERHLAFDTALSSGDSVCVIGRFAATLSAAASYSWSVPSYNQTNLIQRPIFETRWLQYEPTFTGFSANPTDSATTFYRLRYTSVTLIFRTGSGGTSNATTFTVSAPFIARDFSFGRISHPCMIVDNGVLQSSPGLMRITNQGGTSNIIDVYKTYALGGFTASGAKRIDAGIFDYEIL